MSSILIDWSLMPSAKELHRLCYYGSRIKWPVFLFFSMSPHTKNRPFYSAVVYMLQMDGYCISGDELTLSVICERPRKAVYQDMTRPTASPSCTASINRNLIPSMKRDEIYEDADKRAEQSGLYQLLESSNSIMSEVWCRPQVVEIVTVLSLIAQCSTEKRRQEKRRQEKRREKKRREDTFLSSKGKCASIIQQNYYSVL
jgi:hypothetical protein